LPHTFDGSAVQWQTNALAAGASWDVELVVQVTMTDTSMITNLDYLVSSLELPDGLSGDPVTTQILANALTLEKETAVASASPGDLITYTLTAHNPHATAALTGLVLTDTIPAGTNFISATLPFTATSSGVQWTRDMLNAGESWPVTLVVEVATGWTGDLVANNDYAVRSNEITAVTGPPVTTTIKQTVTPTLYLPYIIRQNVPPTPPTSPSPTNGAVGQLTNVTLSWSSSDPHGDALTFNVYLEASDSTPDELVAAGLVVPTFTPDELEAGLTYYWQVLVEDEYGEVVDGPVWNFTTAASFPLQVINLVNQERVNAGCAPLAFNQQLTAAAQGHSTDMALNDFFSHTGSNGSSPWERIDDTGYQWSYAAENIAAGYTTPQAAVNAWMNSDGHRANILNCILEDTGVGYYYLANDTGDTNYHHYWTQVFARP
jgi:uncharacterized repeat protein (TIGR01451 family)